MQNPQNSLFVRRNDKAAQRQKKNRVFARIIADFNENQCGFLLLNANLQLHSTKRDRVNVHTLVHSSQPLTTFISRRRAARGSLAGTRRVRAFPGWECYILQWLAHVSSSRAAVALAAYKGELQPESESTKTRPERAHLRRAGGSGRGALHRVRLQAKRAARR